MILCGMGRSSMELESFLLFILLVMIVYRSILVYRLHIDILGYEASTLPMSGSRGNEEGVLMRCG